MIKIPEPKTIVDLVKFPILLMVFPWTSKGTCSSPVFPTNKNVRDENSCPTLPPVAFGEKETPPVLRSMKKTGYLWT